MEGEGRGGEGRGGWEEMVGIGRKGGSPGKGWGEGEKGERGNGEGGGRNSKSSICVSCHFWFCFLRRFFYRSRSSSFFWRC